MGRLGPSFWLVQALHFFQLLAPRLGPLGSRSPHQIAINKVFQSSYFFLLLLVVLGFGQQFLLLLLHKTRVITDIAVQGMLGQVQGNGCDLIQEIPVVADNEKSSAIINQVIFQPGDGLNIQVVGWLVQYQEIWFF